MLSARFMARGARKLGVRAVQRELCHSMVKGVRVEAYDICVATLVVGVAVLALSGRDPRNSRVEAPSPADIRCDVLVANEAKVVLPPLLKCTMALVAVRFELRVTLDDRSR